MQAARAIIAMLLMVALVDEMSFWLRREVTGGLLLKIIGAANRVGGAPI